MLNFPRQLRNLRKLAICLDFQRWLSLLLIFIYWDPLRKRFIRANRMLKSKSIITFGKVLKGKSVRVASAMHLSQSDFARFFPRAHLLFESLPKLSQIRCIASPGNKLTYRYHIGSSAIRFHAEMDEKGCGTRPAPFLCVTLIVVLESVSLTN